MKIETITRTLRSRRGLDAFLSAVEGGREARPDWIDLQGEAGFQHLAPGHVEALLPRLHGSVRRGFRLHGPPRGGPSKRLAFWQTVARAGFHDFAEAGWMKHYDSAVVENYDYIQPYQERGLAGLDPYQVYSAVLGTWDHTVEDFLHTELCRNVRTIVEPLAGTAEFCYAGHFYAPHLKYCMFDLDPKARAHVAARHWRPNTEWTFLSGDALEEGTWKAVAAASEFPSLAYIGKQSQNFFGSRELMKILEWGTTYTTWLMLEVTEPYVLEHEPTTDDLTRPEMKDAGFRVALEDLEDRPPNPLTAAMDFDLTVRRGREKRVLFEYHDWIGWQPAALVALGTLLDLEIRYYHSERLEFLPVGQETETSDCLENNVFLLFGRRS